MGSTLSTIRGQVRFNLGEISGQNLYLNTELNNYIGMSYRKRFLQMIESGAGYFETTANLALTSGTATIDLSALSPPFVRLSALEKNMSTGTYPILPSERRYEPNFAYGYSGSSSYSQYTYKFRGRLSLVLEPTPLITEAASATTGLKIDYVGEPTFPNYLSSDSFTFSDDFPAVFEPLIVLDATIMAMETKDASGGVSDVATFRNQRDTFEVDFKNAIKPDELPQRVACSGENYNAILFR